MIPFKVVYGRDPPALLQVAVTDDLPRDLYQQLRQRDDVLCVLKSNLVKAQERMKRFADRKRTEVHFDVGDRVFVKLQPYRQHSVALRKHHKLALRYFGPFTIEQKIRLVAYKLKLPESARIYPVFHVSLLKRCDSPTTVPYIPLPLLTEMEGPILHPLAILDNRTVHQQGQWVPQVLVQWDKQESPS